MVWRFPRRSVQLPVKICLHDGAAVLVVLAPAEGEVVEELVLVAQLIHSPQFDSLVYMTMYYQHSAVGREGHNETASH